MQNNLVVVIAVIFIITHSVFSFSSTNITEYIIISIVETVVAFLIYSIFSLNSLKRLLKKIPQERLIKINEGYILITEYQELVEGPPSDSGTYHIWENKCNIQVIDNNRLDEIKYQIDNKFINTLQLKKLISKSKELTIENNKNNENFDEYLHSAGKVHSKLDKFIGAIKEALKYKSEHLGSIRNVKKYKLELHFTDKILLAKNNDEIFEISFLSKLRKLVNRLDESKFPLIEVLYSGEKIYDLYAPTLSKFRKFEIIFTIILFLIVTTYLMIKSFQN